MNNKIKTLIFIYKNVYYENARMFETTESNNSFYKQLTYYYFSTRFKPDIACFLIHLFYVIFKFSWITRPFQIN